MDYFFSFKRNRLFSSLLMFGIIFACLYGYIEYRKDKVTNSFINIGTASMGGVYYPVGSAICKYINLSSANNLRCSVETSTGSIYNINSIKNGNFDIASVQYDAAYSAYYGKNSFKDREPLGKLRVLFQLHTESFTAISKKNSGIKTIDDWQNKRVNIGIPGTGVRQTMNAVMGYQGIAESAFSLASDLKSSEQSVALCDGKIDVMTETIGHPSGVVQEVSSSCKIHIMGIKDNDINNLISLHPYYRRTEIPCNIYKSKNDKSYCDPVPTLGIPAIVVSSTDVSDEAIYNVMKSVFENVEEIRSIHALFADFTEESFVPSKDIEIPLHNGARMFLKERGLI